MELKITSARVAGQWNATAFINNQKVASGAAKSKKSAEEEAKRGAQLMQAPAPQPLANAKFLNGLRPFLQSLKQAA